MLVDELVPPQAYTWWVPALGLILLALVIGWYLWVWRRTRPVPHYPGAAMPLTVRQRFEREIEDGYQRYRTGDLDLRLLHLELARIMRDFASERLGEDVRSLTAGDIGAHHRTQRLGELLAVWEEPSFALRSQAEAQEAVRHAKGVVHAW